jgi:predicted nucleotidyltransferase
VSTRDLPILEILRIAHDRGAYDVRVFGSRARGDARPDSDLDLLVCFESGRSLLDLVGMKRALEELLGIRVDVVSERGLSPYLRDSVLAEAKRLAA